MTSLRSRQDIEREELERLAPWAVHSAASRGRVVAEPEHAYRTVFQRDRDRVVHSRAFRRLEYKTQVFVYHEGDHYRNRLTHTLEGAQIARTIARALRLNEDLAEAVALAHDLGHTPFGHAGERALNQLLADDGGFDHNRQTLRVVDLLEERYPRFRGLNLSYETREGILKHGSAWYHPVPLPELGAQASLEAQVSDLSDEIAYVNHDVDDGLRSGLLTLEELSELRLWRERLDDARARTPEVSPRILRSQALIGLIDHLVSDLIAASAERIAAVGPKDLAALRAHPDRLLAYSDGVARSLRELKDFLFRNLYHHPRVVRMSRKAERILVDLWELYREDPRQMPPQVLARFAEDGEARATGDYIAGMTDRFAQAEHRKLLDPHEPV